MRLYDEIFKNASGMALSRYTVAVQGGGYFEGVKAVRDFSPEKVVLFFPRGSVEVEGVSLSIAKYCDGDLKLDGKITLVRLVDGNTRKGESI